MLRFFKILSFIMLFSFSFSAQAGFSEYYQNLKTDIKDTWNDGRWSVYAPIYAWHNRLAYDKEHIERYNENPWGGGIGKYHYKGNDWHGLYAMAFKDSNDYLETFFGYAFVRNVSLNCADTWRVGYGYTLGVTQRHEYKYIPVPLPLPIASISYRDFSIQAAYVPGIKNDGNVLFTWLKFDF